MLFISTTHKPATDLGFLLHKNPERMHEAEVPFGIVRAFFPVANEESCTVAVVTEMNSVSLVRSHGSLMDQYVNDRSYVASSFMSSALAKLFGTACSGRCKERPELATTPIPLEVRIPTLPCRGGEAFLRGVFEPLGYEVQATHLPLDDSFPEWGPGRLFDVTLRTTKTIQELLQQLRVLIPVMDDEKHYWVQKTEVDKLLNLSSEWLPSHPLKEEITKRYMLRQAVLTREALEKLSEEDGIIDPDAIAEVQESQEEKIERPLSLHDIRLNRVCEVVTNLKAKSVVDLGCGEGRLVRLLLKERSIQRIVGMDVSVRSLEKATVRLKIDRMPEKSAEKLTLIHGSLLYRDQRIAGFDAATLVEVIEHLDPPRLSAMERVVFEVAKPEHVIVTTPNREYNVLFEGMSPDAFRHGDHRFEWSRAEFQTWVDSICSRFGYVHTIEPLGPLNETHGAPSQMAIFTRWAG